MAMKLQKEAASESDILDMVANPVRFVRREEIAVKVRSLMRRVAGRGVRARKGRMRDGDDSRRVIATELGSVCSASLPRHYGPLQTFKCHESSQPRQKKKKEKRVTVVTQTSLATDT
jgi:hypothetical protein